MRYWRSYFFFLDSPQWAWNLFCCTVCVLVPIVGQMVLMGYAFEIAERRHLRSEKHYSDFDLEKLSRYLIRGAWPFLVGLIVRLPLALVAIAAYVGFLFMLAAAGQTKGASPTPVLGYIGLAFPGVMVLTLLTHFVLVPLSLRAGVGQDFAGAFSWTFLRDFLARVWGTLLLVFLFEVVSGFVLILAGMLLCFIGLYPATALMQVGQIDLWYQLYDLYLQRGGEPVPLKVEPVHEEGILPADDRFHARPEN